MALLLALAGCETKYDERSFRRAAEEAYSDVHPGWTIYRREDAETIYVRGDQLDRLPVDELFVRYEESGQGGRAFFRAWKEEQRAEIEARRRTLDQSRRHVIPIVRSGSWVRVQDLAAIGPERIQKDIRPWRQEVTEDVFVVLGIPEEKLGFRFASIREVETATTTVEGGWLAQAVRNLEARVGVEHEGVEVRSDDGKLLAVDLPNLEGISGLILSEAFRRSVLKRFNKPAVGAAVPIRNVLLLFDQDEFTAKKPVRARAHELYDTQNHPGFRGLLLIEADGVSLLEPGQRKAPR